MLCSNIKNIIALHILLQKSRNFPIEKISGKKCHIYEYWNCPMQPFFFCPIQPYLVCVLIFPAFINDQVASAAADPQGTDLFQKAAFKQFLTAPSSLKKRKSVFEHF